MRKELIISNDGKPFAYELLNGYPKNIDDDFKKLVLSLKYANCNPGLYFINILPKTLISYYKDILAYLKTHRKNIVIELVELNSSVNKELLSKVLQDINVDVAIDDFGSKSSNFDRLDLPNIKYVKFDGVFWKQHTKDILIPIINFVKNKGYKIIAEQVETSEDLRIAKELKFNFLQGYFFKSKVKELEYVA